MNTKVLKVLFIFAVLFTGTLLFLNGPLSAAPATPAASNHIVEYPIPVPGSEPGAIVVENPGSIWFTMPGTDQIGHLLVAPGGTHSFEFRDLPGGSNPYGLVYDGQYIWYTAMGTDKLGRIDPTTPSNTPPVEYTIPGPNDGPADIDVSPAGLVWFAEHDSSQIASFNPQTSNFTEYAYTTKAGNLADPEDIFVVDNDRILFTTPDQNEVIEFVPSDYGDPNLVAFTRFSVSDPSDFSTYRPEDIIVNERGSVWISTPQRDALAERSDLTQELWAFYILPSAGAYPTALASSVTDNYAIIWFVETGGGRVGQFLKTRSGKIVGFREYNLPSPNSQPYDIAVDAQGHAWITEWGANKIAKWAPPYFNYVYLPTTIKR